MSAGHRHPHVAWRNGRPRFSPGRNLRAAGHKGKDLRHPDGKWFNETEAIAWSRQFRAGVFRESAADDVPQVPAKPAGEGYVYFLWCGNAIKIGFTRNPFRRAPEIMVGASAEIRLFVAVPSSHDDEQRLHRRLNSHRLRGEWFKANGYVVNVMRMAINESDGIYRERATKNGKSHVKVAQE